MNKPLLYHNGFLMELDPITLKLEQVCKKCQTTHNYQNDEGLCLECFLGLPTRLEGSD